MAASSHERLPSAPAASQAPSSSYGMAVLVKVGAYVDTANWLVAARGII